jgi:hypothetical protein
MAGRKAAIVTLLLIGLLLSSPLPTTSQSGIVVDGADSVQNTATVYSSGLANAIESVDPRVAVEYSHSTEPRDLTDIPTTLWALVDAVTPRVVVEYANSTQPHRLIEMPTALQGFIDLVSDRVVIEYANAGNGAPLVYPLELMDDNQAPEISNVRAVGDLITWTTDEFATSTVLYGLQTGHYTEPVTDPLYARQHEVTLPGVVMGTTYYFKVRSTDRSGNTSTSAEHSFTAQIPVYFPLVARDS